MSVNIGALAATGMEVILKCVRYKAGFGSMGARGRGNTNFGSMGARGGLTQTLGRWGKGEG